MNIFKLAAQIFLIYLGYRFIFHFVIPLYHSFKKVKSQMNEMQGNGEAHFKSKKQAAEVKKETKPKEKGEYIEFEEVK